MADPIEYKPGWNHNPEEIEVLISQMTQPFFAQAGDVLKDTGKGKSRVFYTEFKPLGINYPKPLQVNIGDCVSQAASISNDCLIVSEITAGEREKWVARTACEYIYHTSRVIIGKGRFRGQDGSLNGWAVKGMQEYGILSRIKYDSVDMSNYDESRAVKWGDNKIDSKILDLGKEHTVQKYSIISNFEDAMNSLYNGFPILVASNQGFSNKRDKEGFAAPSGNWGHSMGVIGYKDDKRPAVLIQNSWPSYLPGENPLGLPPSSFWCDADVFNRMCKFNDTYSIAGFNGYKLRSDMRVI